MKCNTRSLPCSLNVAAAPLRTASHPRTCKEYRNLFYSTDGSRRWRAVKSDFWVNIHAKIYLVQTRKHEVNIEALKSGTITFFFSFLGHHVLITYPFDMFFFADYPDLNVLLNDFWANMHAKICLVQARGTWREHRSAYILLAEHCGISLISLFFLAGVYTDNSLWF